MRWIGMAAILAVAFAVRASDDDNLAAASKFARTFGVSENPALVAAVKGTLVAANPKKIPPSAEPVVEAWLTEMFASPQWSTEVGKIIASHLQPEDIAVLQAQYETPSWRRLQEALPGINKAVSAQIDKAIRDGESDLRKRLREAGRSR
jgi:hypothetical protein